MIPNRFAAPVPLLVFGFLLLAPPALGQSRPAQPAPAKPGAKPAATAPSPASDGQPTELGQYGGWTAYAATSGGRKVCFALGKPASSQTNPPNRPRDPAYLFVSTRPAENVRNEISVVIGYPFKPNYEATADIGGAKFTMRTENDGAWLKNLADEPRMVEAMRKASDLVVKGQSGKGTETTDRFSLKGLAQAIDRVNQQCR
jgi:Invasion associated locus B (IalB) protein